MMEAREALAAAEVRGGTIVSVGVFDGVHIGHRYLLGRLKAQARERGLSPAVITFRNHPRTVLAPGAPVSYLCPLEERLALLKAIGIEHLVPLTFTRELSLVSARQFVGLLVQHLGMRGMVMGPDFALGHGREGTPAVLQAFGEELGYTVAVVEPIGLEGQGVSSTAVRRSLAKGDMPLAAKLLGRPFTLSGPVVAGAGRGRALGVPTANLAVDSDMALPLDGVYCTWASIGGRRHPSVTSIGVRPTFGDLPRCVETHILDYQADLYGQDLKIELVQRLRDQEKFESLEELVAQMKRDIEQARGLMAAGAPR